ncbi:MAG: BatA domain-containing protein [Planctomycetota bacterium]|nr:BatA domain-containing protein [Planctomycetota bacterium]
MAFVQTAFFGAFAALAIPIIVHLMFRMRTRRVNLGTVRFLREVLHKNARRKKVKRFVLLALRMAGVALLATLFARPYFIAQGFGSSDRLVAVLIDRSASMELRAGGERLIDQAVDQTKTIIQERGRNARVEIAFFDHTIRPLGADQGDGKANDVIRDLIAPEATYCSTDFGAAFSWARDICVKAGRSKKELHVFTDLQRSGLDWSEVAEMPDDVQVELHDLGRDSPNNVAVTAVAVTRTLVRPGDVSTVHVTVSNAGPFPLKEVPLRLFLRSDRRTYNQDRQVSIAAGGLEQFAFQVAGLETGLWQGQVEIEIEDELRFDNRRFLALMAAPPWKVLIVDGQPHVSPILSETYFLESALRLAPPDQTYANTPYDPKVVNASEVAETDFEDYALVVLANVEGLSSAAAKRLVDFVDAGGGLIVFSGENIDSAGYRSFESVGLTPGTFVDIKQADDLPFRMQEWDEQHSIFGPFNDPQHGDLRRLAFQAYTKIEPSPQASVLASFRGGDPLLLEVTKGQGRALWFTSSCDRQWSDWPRSRLYLPLVHQMLGHLTGLNEGGPVRALTIDASSGLAADIKPGVYERARYWEVINPSPRESETDRCTPMEFSDRFALHVGGSNSSADQLVAAVAPTTVELRDDEIWHWIAFALVGVLCVECFLANRTTA